MFSLSNQKNNELRAAIDDINQTFVDGNPEFFDYLTEDVTVYSVNSAEPFIGREAYQAYFEPILRGHQREVSLLKTDIQVVGRRRAIVTRTSNVHQNGVIVTVRQSQSWIDTEDGWKINHLHTAIVGSPKTAAPDSVEAVRVMNERIATIAAVLGVAQ